MFAQDPHFSQFYSNPLFLNPAMTGLTENNRVVANQRIQWAGISSFSTSSLSYDARLKRFGSGLGVQLMYDNQANIIKGESMNISYAVAVPLAKDIYFRTGLQSGLYQKRLDWNELHFEDEIHPRFGFINQTSESPGGLTTQNLDISGGTTLQGHDWYAGVAVHHINRPLEKIGGGGYRLPARVTIHGGMDVSIQDHFKEKYRISTHFIYMNQGTFKQLHVGTYFGYERLTVGVWHRWMDAFVFMFGTNSDNFKFSYSYDLTVSKLGTQSGGAHELSFTLYMKQKLRKRKKYGMPNKPTCPNFYKRLI